MRICLVNTLYQIDTLNNTVGGAEISVRILAETLAALGHDVHVICLAPPTYEGQAQVTQHVAQQISGVSIWFVPINNLYFPEGKARPAWQKILWHGIDSDNLLMTLPLKRILKALQPDMVHTNIISGFSTSIWRLCKAMGFPVVHTLRDYYLLCARGTLYKNEKNCEQSCRSCQLLTHQKKKLSETVSAVVGISQYILDKHMQAGLFQQVIRREVIHNPFRPGTPYPKVRGHEISDTLSFGFIGQIVPEKGLALLLEAFTALNHPQARLLIAGKGTQADWLQQQYQHHPHIKWLGFQHPHDFFPAIDVLIQPALWQEPLSRVIIEAYAAGKPVLAAARGGMPEIIEEGKTGWVFDPNQPQQLQDLMQQLLDNPQQLAHTDHNSTKAAMNHFTPELVGKRYTQLYDFILEKQAQLAS
ncbi:MAG: glycosyltransferase family 4 protein [Alphaproteobacteria bacterium]